METATKEDEAFVKWHNENCVGASGLAEKVFKAGYAAACADLEAENAKLLAVCKALVEIKYIGVAVGPLKNVVSLAQEAINAAKGGAM